MWSMGFVCPNQRISCESSILWVPLPCAAVQGSTVTGHLVFEQECMLCTNLNTSQGATYRIGVCKCVEKGAHEVFQVHHALPVKMCFCGRIRF